MSEIQKNTQENVKIKSYEIDDFQQLEEVNQKVFSIVDNLGYGEIKDKLSNDNSYSFEDVLEELGEQKASVFFYWYVLHSNASLENKKYFLSKAIDSEYNKEFVKLFSRQQFRDFAFFVVDNNLIDNFYSELKLYLDFLDEDFFQDKYAHLFIYIESFENEYIDDIVDFVLDNMKVIHNSLQQIENSQEYKDINDFTPHKENFDLQINKLLNLNYRYFLEKLNSLEDEVFIFITQNLLVEVINNFFNLEKINDIFNGENDGFKKQLKIFIDKLGNIGLENIKINFLKKYTDYGYYKTENKENNYFNILLEYKKELFEKIDIQDILGKKTNLPDFIFENKTFEEIFKNKFLEIKNINYGDLIQNPGYVISTDYVERSKNVLLSDEIINHIANNFTEQEKINFIVFLKKRTDLYYTFVDEENNFLQKMFNNKEIEYIFSYYRIINFISLFPEGFLNFDSIISSKQIKLFLDLSIGKVKKINIIFEFFKKVENINFKIKLEHINEEFIDFILNNFYFDPGDTSKGILSCNLKELNEFFDIEVDSLDFFGNDIKKENNGFIGKIKNKFKKDKSDKAKEKTFQIQNYLGNSRLISNLKEIFKIYNIEFKLSNLIELEKNFNNFLGNKNIFLSNFLCREKSIISIYNYLKKYNNKYLVLNDFLLVLTEVDIINLHYIEAFDENLNDFDAKDLIKINGNKLTLRNDLFFYVNKIEMLNSDYLGIYTIFEIFNGWTKEKLLNFLEFFQKANFVGRSIDSDSSYIKKKFSNIFGSTIVHYCGEENRIFLIRYLTQKAIDNNDFSILHELINTILQNRNDVFNDINNLKEIIKYNLFAIPSQGSNILLQLLKKLENKVDKKRLYSLENFLSNDLLNQMYQIMKNDIEEFLSKQNLEKKCTMVNQYSKLDISIYLRYGHTVNFPEIGEYIVLFVDTFLEKGYSKYIKNIRLIPRNYKGVYIPRQVFFKNTKNVELYNVSGSEFKVALENDSIPFHLSHSYYKNNFDRPYIISGGMKRNNDKNEIVANFELEESVDFNDTSKISLEQIFKELVSILNIIDEKMDRKCRNK